MCLESKYKYLPYFTFYWCHAYKVDQLNARQSQQINISYVQVVGGNTLFLNLTFNMFLQTDDLLLKY